MPWALSQHIQLVCGLLPVNPTPVNLSHSIQFIHFKCCSMWAIKHTANEMLNKRQTMEWFGQAAQVVDGWIIQRRLGKGFKIRWTRASGLPKPPDRLYKGSCGYLFKYIASHGGEQVFTFSLICPNSVEFRIVASLDACIQKLHQTILSHRMTMSMLGPVTWEPHSLTREARISDRNRSGAAWSLLPGHF